MWKVRISSAAEADQEADPSNREASGVLMFYTITLCVFVIRH
jgi:hypothetical protein